MLSNPWIFPRNWIRNGLFLPCNWNHVTRRGKKCFFFRTISSGSLRCLKNGNGEFVTLKHLLYTTTVSCFIDPEPYPNCLFDLLDFWRWRPSTKNRAFTTASWLEATKLSSKSKVFSAACFVHLWSLRYAWMWGHPCCGKFLCMLAGFDDLNTSFSLLGTNIVLTSSLIGLTR